jgi:hypothetical protein
MGYRIAFPGLSVNVTNRLVVIQRSDRKDTPHLTISFENASGEIDIHLKHESPKNDATSTYKSILKIPKASIEVALEEYFRGVGEAFLRICFSRIKRIRPGWLARNGYLLMWLNEESLKQEVINAAPKQRGKYRVDAQKLKTALLDFDQSKINFCDPSELHTLAAEGFNGQVYGIRARRRKKLHSITLHCVQWGVNKSWITFDRNLSNDIIKMFEESIPQRFKEKAKAVWDEIYNALKLDEIGIERDALNHR